MWGKVVVFSWEIEVIVVGEVRPSKVVRGGIGRGGMHWTAIGQILVGMATWNNEIKLVIHMR